MQGKELDYPQGRWRDIYPAYLELVDSILLAYLGWMWEEMRDILPAGQPNTLSFTYDREDLRTSALGQSLLLIADYAGRSHLFIDKGRVERACKRVCRMLYGDPLSDANSLPSKFHQNDLGRLFRAVYKHMYTRSDLLTPKEAYTLVGVARQSLYDRLYDARRFTGSMIFDFCAARSRSGKHNGKNEKGSLHISRRKRNRHGEARY